MIKDEELRFRECEERASMAYGYPEGAIERVHEIEVEILKATAEVCEKLGIEWFADSGTAIGAVRHNGFIPWDDDIDIAMRIEDYRRFCKEAPALLPDGYGLYTHASTENYAPLWAKVYKKGTRFMSQELIEANATTGLFVDVFAYSRLDSDKATAARQIRGMIFWQRVSYLYYSAHPKIPSNTPCKPLVKALCKVAHYVARALFPPKDVESRFDRVVESGNGQGKWINISYPTYGTFDERTLFPTRIMPFEGMHIPVPNDTHLYLTTMYGDYMKLPPEEDRCTHSPVILDFGDGVNVLDSGEK